MLVYTVSDVYDCAILCAYTLAAHRTKLVTFHSNVLHWESIAFKSIFMFNDHSSKIGRFIGIQNLEKIIKK